MILMIPDLTPSKPAAGGVLLKTAVCLITLKAAEQKPVSSMCPGKLMEKLLEMPCSKLPTAPNPANQ